MEELRLQPLAPWFLPAYKPLQASVWAHCSLPVINWKVSDRNKRFLISSTSVIYDRLYTVASRLIFDSNAHFVENFLLEFQLNCAPSLAPLQSENWFIIGTNALCKLHCCKKKSYNPIFAKKVWLEIRLEVFE